MELNLAGQWKFKEDQGRRGIAEKWFLQTFTDTITIPGTMEESGYGEEPRVPSTNDLNHSYYYRGWAWYQTAFELSEEQAAQIITLFLARIQWDSFVWVDGKYIGNQNSLAVPHQYELRGLSAGRHQLVILIDNSNIKTNAQMPDEAEAEENDAEGRSLTLHLHTADNGSKKLACGIHLDMYAFNGIVGEAKLIIKPKLHIIRTDIYPDIHNQTVQAKVLLCNEGQYAGGAEISVACQDVSERMVITLNGEKEQSICLTLDFHGAMRLWDEYDPFVYTFTTKLTYESIADSHEVSCGLRELRAEGRHLILNDNRLFFRATLEGAAFPYTGYTPMDEAFWLRAFRILKSYGLNGMRMHSFVPPKAAFDAAEQVGFYLQIELPGTSCPGTDEAPEVTAFLSNELKKTLELYGNYACFLFMAMGNEQLVSSDKDFVQRHQKILMEKVAYAKQADPRHLYTCTSHNHTEGRNDDLFVVATKDELVLNGIAWGGPDPITTSRFSLLPPSTKVNFQEGVERMDRPAITHEVGQWAVYPNFAEMPKYTGVLKPRNYEVFAAQLDKNGMLHQNGDFVRNSGTLSLLLYKEEIESALRTPDLSGFELLDIHDYPGQGTSTVGILDCFFDSKGLTTPEEFRQFCAPVVPLCSFDKYVYCSGENMELTPMIANYSIETIKGEACVTVETEDGSVLYRQVFDVEAPKGQLTEFASLQVPLSSGRAVSAAIIFEVPESSLVNRWNIWVYPDKLSEAEAEPNENGSMENDRSDEGVITVTELDQEAERLLKQGKDLLYIHPYDVVPENGCQGSFTSQFWNPFMKPQETKNGILCDPDHALFKDFPTCSHTDYQWWEILKVSRFMYMDQLPREFFPIVQIIPGIKDNRKIGLIWECKTENGRVLVCTADLRKCENRPAARQLLYSIRNYMKSDAFNPQQEITLQTLRNVLK